MATDEEPSTLEIKDLAADHDRERTHNEREEEAHASINYTSYSEGNTPPRLKLTNHNIIHVYAKVRSKFKNYHYCLWSSKAVILILVWNFIISIGFKSFFDPSLYTVTILKFAVDYYYFEYSSMLMLYGTVKKA